MRLMLRLRVGGVGEVGRDGAGLGESKRNQLTSAIIIKNGKVNHNHLRDTKSPTQYTRNLYSIAYASFEGTAVITFKR